MGVAALLLDQMLRFSVVILTQRNTRLLCRLYQTLPGTVNQSRVGRKANVLLLNRGIHIEAGKLGWFYQPLALTPL